MAVEKDGVPASGWAYTPDKEETSTWKLNISDAVHVSAASAALGPGFRGNKVQIPEEDLPAVKRKVRAAYKKFHPDLDLPEVLKASEFTDSLASLIEKFFGGSTSQKEVETVSKSLDLEQRRALFVVLEPQDPSDVKDLHGDFYTAEEVEKACISFNTHCNKANLFHKVQTENAKIEQSFISPSSFTLEDGRYIQKGSWLQWWHFPEEDEVADKLWTMVKAGEINGVSIGAKANTESLD